MLIKTLVDFNDQRCFLLRELYTAQNAAISPNFMVWKFCGKAQFPHSFGRFARNCAFPQNFHTMKLGEITAVYAVIDISLFRKSYFTTNYLPLILIPLSRVQEKEHLDIIFITADYNFV